MEFFQILFIATRHEVGIGGVVLINTLLTINFGRVPIYNSFQ